MCQNSRRNVLKFCPNRDKSSLLLSPTEILAAAHFPRVDRAKSTLRGEISGLKVPS